MVECAKTWYLVWCRLVVDESFSSKTVHYNYPIGRRHIVEGQCRGLDNQQFFLPSLIGSLATHTHTVRVVSGPSLSIFRNAESEQTFTHCQIDLKIILSFYLRVGA